MLYLPDDRPLPLRPLGVAHRPSNRRLRTSVRGAPLSGRCATPIERRGFTPRRTEARHLAAQSSVAYLLYASLLFRGNLPHLRRRGSRSGAPLSGRCAPPIERRGPAWDGSSSFAATCRTSGDEARAAALLLRAEVSTWGRFRSGQSRRGTEGAIMQNRAYHIMCKSLHAMLICILLHGAGERGQHGCDVCCNTSPGRPLRAPRARGTRADQATARPCCRGLRALVGIAGVGRCPGYSSR